jgi:hypothetical protein
MRDGQRYRAEQGIPWPIAIDDLSGTTHQVYGGMADPTYLIDANGRVAFYNMWTHVPTLYCAVRELAHQGGVDTVLGRDRSHHAFRAGDDRRMACDPAWADAKLCPSGDRGTGHGRQSVARLSAAEPVGARHAA